MMPARALVVLHVEADSGPQRSLAPRLARMAAAGTELSFLLPGEGPGAEQARALGAVSTAGPAALTLPRSPLDALRRLRLLRDQARATERAARAADAELVVVSSPALAGALAGARRAGAATLLYCGESPARGGVRGLAAAALARRALRGAGALVAPSRHVASWYERRGAAVSVVHPPIAPPPAPGELRERGTRLRERLGIGADARVVAALGAITAGRGQHLLIEALAGGAAGGGWTLVIGGEPYPRPPDVAYRDRLRRRIEELGLAGRVVLAGRVADPAALYAAADVFANPAVVPEGFGRAACEALACGCPVVSTRAGGVPEALRDGETALLVEPGSAAALGAAIARLLGDRELAARLARAGGADVARRLAPRAGQAAFDAAVERALRARRPGA